MPLKFSVLCAVFAALNCFAQSGDPSTPTVFPDFDKTNEELAKLRAEIAELTKNIQKYGDIINSNWQVTNIQVTRAVNIAEERYTVGTLTGIAIGVGLIVALVPAAVNLAFVPIYHRMLRTYHPNVQANL